MTTKITFELDGKPVEAEPGETIWQVAQRHGTKIPHLCWHPRPAIAPTATAAPAWSRSRASACWRPRASARPRPA